MARVVMTKGDRTVTVELCQTMKIAKARARYYGSMTSCRVSFRAESS